jgi:hypothetical protein
MNTVLNIANRIHVLLLSITMLAAIYGCGGGDVSGEYFGATKFTDVKIHTGSGLMQSQMPAMERKFRSHFSRTTMNCKLTLVQEGKKISGEALVDGLPFPITGTLANGKLIINGTGRHQRGNMIFNGFRLEGKVDDGKYVGNSHLAMDFISKSFFGPDTVLNLDIIGNFEIEAISKGSVQNVAGKYSGEAKFKDVKVESSGKLEQSKIDELKKMFESDPGKNSTKLKLTLVQYGDKIAGDAFIDKDPFSVSGTLNGDKLTIICTSKKPQTHQGMNPFVIRMEGDFDDNKYEGDLHMTMEGSHPSIGTIKVNVLGEFKSKRIM